MNFHAARSKAQLVEKIQTLIGDSLTGQDLIQALEGVHPVEIKQVLVELGDETLLERALGPLKVSKPVLLEITRDDNPVLSFWPFTVECGHQIVDLIPSNSSVALLGVPTVFSLLANTKRNNVKLFDSDGYFFSKETTQGYIQCDLLSEQTVQFNDSFDLVLADPPWYLTEYRSWLIKSVSLARAGGEVIFVLFPQYVRANAKAEQDEILSLASELLIDVELLQIEAEYETPSFEKVELSQCGIAPVNWRKAKFIRGRVPSEKKVFPLPPALLQPEIWTERRLGCGRIFVNDKPSEVFKFLETADPASRFLSSPSKRDPARQRANVISSRGHALRCRDPKEFLGRLDKIRSAEEIETVASSLDRESASLLKLVAEDLWPRFITVT